MPTLPPAPIPVNGIKDEGAKALLEAVQKNTGLRTLWLNGVPRCLAQAQDTQMHAYSRYTPSTQPVNQLLNLVFTHLPTCLLVTPLLPAGLPSPLCAIYKHRNCKQTIKGEVFLLPSDTYP